MGDTRQNSEDIGGLDPHQLGADEVTGARTQKTRKPYTITKQRERWTDDEHQRFVEALKVHGRQWRKIEEVVKTKTAVQIRSHAQKFFTKIEKQKQQAQTGQPAAQPDVPIDITIPPPRPKRKAVAPYPRKHGSSDDLEYADTTIPLFPDYAAALRSHGQATDVTVAAVTAAASAAAAAAAAAVVAAAGKEIEAKLHAAPPNVFPFYGMTPSMLRAMSNPATLQANIQATVNNVAINRGNGTLHQHFGVERTGTSQPGHQTQPPLVHGEDGEDSACSREDAELTDATAEGVKGGNGSGEGLLPKEEYLQANAKANNTSNLTGLAAQVQTQMPLADPDTMARLDHAHWFTNPLNSAAYLPSMWGGAPYGNGGQFSDPGSLAAVAQLWGGSDSLKTGTLPGFTAAPSVQRNGSGDDKQPTLNQGGEQEEDPQGGGNQQGNTKKRKVGLGSKSTDGSKSQEGGGGGGSNGEEDGNGPVAATNKKAHANQPKAEGEGSGSNPTGNGNGNGSSMNGSVHPQANNGNGNGGNGHHHHAHHHHHHHHHNHNHASKPARKGLPPVAAPPTHPARAAPAAAAAPNGTTNANGSSGRGSNDKNDTAGQGGSGPGGAHGNGQSNGYGLGSTAHFGNGNGISSKLAASIPAAAAAAAAAAAVTAAAVANAAVVTTKVDNKSPPLAGSMDRNNNGSGSGNNSAGEKGSGGDGSNGNNNNNGNGGQGSGGNGSGGNGSGGNGSGNGNGHSTADGAYKADPAAGGNGNTNGNGGNGQSKLTTSMPPPPAPPNSTATAGKMPPLGGAAAAALGSGQGGKAVAAAANNGARQQALGNTAAAMKHEGGAAGASKLATNAAAPSDGALKQPPNSATPRSNSPTDNTTHQQQQQAPTTTQFQQQVIQNQAVQAAMHALQATGMHQLIMQQSLFAATNFPASSNNPNNWSSGPTLSGYEAFAMQQHIAAAAHYGGGAGSAPPARPWSAFTTFGNNGSGGTSGGAQGSGGCQAIQLPGSQQQHGVQQQQAHAQTETQRQQQKSAAAVLPAKRPHPDSANAGGQQQQQQPKSGTNGGASVPVPNGRPTRGAKSGLPQANNAKASLGVRSSGSGSVDGSGQTTEAKRRSNSGSPRPSGAHRKKSRPVPSDDC